MLLWVRLCLDLYGLMCAYLFIQTWLHGYMKSERSVFQFSYYLLSVFLFTLRVCVSIHQSDNVSLCVGMKDPARQIERKRKRQVEEKKKNMKLLMSACLLAFVCLFPTQQAEHISGSFWWWRRQEKHNNALNLHNSFPQLGPKVPVNLCCVT